MSFASAALPAVTVVIPTKDAAGTIGECVRSCCTDCQVVAVEVVVVDNNSADGTPDVAAAAGAVVVAGGPERSAQRNIGAALARGDWVLFLDADMVLGKGTIAACLKAVVDADAVGCIVPERATGQGFWAECRALEKEIYVGDPDVEAARFFSRRHFLGVGGYDEAIHGGGEDWDLPLRMAEIGGRIVRCAGEILHQEGTLALRVTAKKKFYYGRTLPLYVRRHPRVALRQLTRRAFFRRWRLLVSDPVHGLGLIVLKLVDFSCGIAGMVVATLGKAHPLDGQHVDAAQRQGSSRGPDVLILSLGFSPNVGGLETHLDDLVDYLAGLNRTVLVHTLQPFTTDVRASPIESGPHRRIFRHHWIGRGWFHQAARIPVLGFVYTFPAMVMAAWAARRSRPSVVYAQGIAAAAASRLVFRRHRRVVALHSEVQFRSRTARLVAAKALRTADSVLCISDRIRAQALDLGIPPDRCVVFHYWIDLDRFRPLPRVEARRKLEWNEDFVVLFVGRLIREKGPDRLLEAAALLSDDGVCVVFAGTGPESERIRSATGRLPNVRFLGPVSQADLPTLYSAADLLVVPSTSEEGFGRVILEALACGTPVLASRRGGIPEALPPQVGVLVEPIGSEIAERIRRLKNDPGEIAALRHAARRFATEKYSSANARLVERVLFPGRTPD
jgi:glycosyltransferase involved in cell wall biosynthesis